MSIRMDKSEKKKYRGGRENKFFEKLKDTP